jgi:hypothetical protein
MCFFLFHGLQIVCLDVPIFSKTKKHRILYTQDDTEKFSEALLVAGTNISPSPTLETTEEAAKPSDVTNTMATITPPSSIFPDKLTFLGGGNDTSSEDLFRKQQLRQEEKRQETISLVISFSAFVGVLTFLGCMAYVRKRIVIKHRMEQIKIQYLLQRPVPSPPPRTILPECHTSIELDNRRVKPQIQCDIETTCAFDSSIAETSQTILQQ